MKSVYDAEGHVTYNLLAHCPSAIFHLSEFSGVSPPTACPCAAFHTVIGSLPISMMSSAAPPQLDEFFLDQDLHLRRDELRALALPET